MDNLVPAKDSSIPSDRIDNRIFKPSDKSGGTVRVSVEQLLLAGAHFGHLKQRWNPKMKPYIFSSRNGIYLIDLNKTALMLEAACQAITKIAGEGDEVLFVGTKKQARDVIEEEAKRCQCPFITYRWLGGMLTNHSTIRRSLKTLETFDKMSSDGTFESLTKKEQLSINKSRIKLERTLGGIRDMRKLPGAVFVIDTKRELIAVAEAKKLHIPIFAIVDTNVDPDNIDYKIPANDDAFKSIWLIVRTIADAILEGKSKLKDISEVVEAKDRPRDERPKPRRGRRRRQKYKPDINDSNGNTGKTSVMPDDSAGNLNSPTAKMTDAGGNVSQQKAKIDKSAGNISKSASKQNETKGNVKEPANEPG